MSECVTGILVDLCFNENAQTPIGATKNNIDSVLRTRAPRDDGTNGYVLQMDSLDLDRNHESALAPRNKRKSPLTKASASFDSEGDMLEDEVFDFGDISSSPQLGRSSEDESTINDILILKENIAPPCNTLKPTEKELSAKELVEVFKGATEIAAQLHDYRTHSDPGTSLFSIHTSNFAQRTQKPKETSPRKEAVIEIKTVLLDKMIDSSVSKLPPKTLKSTLSVPEPVIVAVDKEPAKVDATLLNCAEQKTEVEPESLIAVVGAPKVVAAPVLAPKIVAKKSETSISSVLRNNRMKAVSTTTTIFRSKPMKAIEPCAPSGFPVTGDNTKPRPSIAKNPYSRTSVGAAVRDLAPPSSLKVHTDDNSAKMSVPSSASVARVNSFRRSQGPKPVATNKQIASSSINRRRSDVPIDTGVKPVPLSAAWNLANTSGFGAAGGHTKTLIRSNSMIGSSTTPSVPIFAGTTSSRTPSVRRSVSCLPTPFKSPGPQLSATGDGGRPSTPSRIPSLTRANSFTATQRPKTKICMSSSFTAVKPSRPASYPRLDSTPSRKLMFDHLAPPTNQSQSK